MYVCDENETDHPGMAGVGQVDDLYALPVKGSMESGRQVYRG